MAKKSSGTTSATQAVLSPQKLPVFRHATGRWAKKIAGKLVYLGRIDEDPDATRALQRLKEYTPTPDTRRREDGVKAKPGKPHPDFPLFPHANGQWAKKVLGRLHYFGKVDEDPDGSKALNAWLDVKDDLLGGRIPQQEVDAFTVEDLCDLFLASKETKLLAAEITARTFADCRDTCLMLIEYFGRHRQLADLKPQDFTRYRGKLSSGRSAKTRKNIIGRTRGIFHFAKKNGYLDSLPFGTEFECPSDPTLRREKQTYRETYGPQVFTAAEIRNFLEAAGVHMRAMILLGINSGIGNSDIGRLRFSHIDRKRRWVNFPRPKSSVDREFPLWPETLAAIDASMAKRPKPKDPADETLVFVTRYGRGWASENDPGQLSKEFSKLIRELGVTRPKAGFYDLRRTFETVASDTGDQVAIDLMMGHGKPSNDMASVYRQSIDPARLKRVSEHVRKWLFTKAGKRGAK